MKKELNTYDPILGFTEFNEWSYSVDNQMWYEDKIEPLPQPPKKSEITEDFVCEIKVNHDSCWGDSWEDLKEEKNGLENFAGYIFREKEHSSYDGILSGVLFKSLSQDLVIKFNDGGFIELDSFVNKLKNSDFATQYFENAGYFCKFIAWTDNKNNTRFVIYSYRSDYEYLKILFDINVSREILVAKLENIIGIWKQTIRDTIIQYAKTNNENLSDMLFTTVIKYCFPDIKEE